MFVKTMAIRITKENYPIALACLPGGFASIPLELVLKQVLVINQPDAGYTQDEGAKIVLQNFWMPWELFLEEYETVEDVAPENNEQLLDLFDGFIEVARVRRAEVKSRPRIERDPIMDEYNGRRAHHRRPMVWGPSVNDEN